jgi:hypothetical protein
LVIAARQRDEHERGHLAHHQEEEEDVREDRMRCADGLTLTACVLACVVWCRTLQEQIMSSSTIEQLMEENERQNQPKGA